MMFNSILKCAAYFERCANRLPEWLRGFDETMQENFNNPEYLERVRKYNEFEQEERNNKLKSNKIKIETDERDILNKKLNGKWLVSKLENICILCGADIEINNKMFLSDDGPLHPSCCGHFKNIRRKELLKKRTNKLVD